MSPKLLVSEVPVAQGFLLGCYFIYLLLDQLKYKSNSISCFSKNQYQEICKILLAEFCADSMKVWFIEIEFPLALIVLLICYGCFVS